MNEDVLLIAVFCLGVCVWNLYLQHKLKICRIALDGAMLMVFDIADGKAVVEKTGNGIKVRRIENEQV